ncbi:hypothetical protein LCGC14_1343440 [marine sediment metagenome]|uniref:Uncharacterized protein n=1 Tax=marine sediment metagenome TaxID=412755 RepID=A0A0F9MTV9_9ZZZZ
MKKILLMLSVVLLLTGLGCAAISHYATPAGKDQGSIKYIVDNSDGHVEDYEVWPWFNLHTANKLKEDLDDSHQTVQHRLRQAMEDDQLEYGQHSDVVITNVQQARQREEALFGEKGLLSMGLSLTGMGAFTGILGLMRKRPGDITPTEVSGVVANATGQTVAELEVRNKQLFQVVKGVQEFINGGTPGQYIAQLKADLSGAQDVDTQLAVKAAKAGA